MRLSMLVICILSTAALAHKVNLKTGWLLEFTMADGSFSRVGVYDTKKECENDIPKVLKEWSAYNGHCVHFDSKTMHIDGSQDPKANSPTG